MRNGPPESSFIQRQICRLERRLARDRQERKAESEYFRLNRDSIIRAHAADLLHAGPAEAFLTTVEPQLDPPQTEPLLPELAPPPEARPRLQPKQMDRQLRVKYFREIERVAIFRGTIPRPQERRPRLSVLAEQNALPKEGRATAEEHLGRVANHEYSIKMPYLCYNTFRPRSLLKQL